MILANISKSQGYIQIQRTKTFEYIWYEVTPHQPTYTFILLNFKTTYMSISISDWLCISSWWLWFWSIYLLYYCMHIIHYSCILSDWNKLFLREIYIPRLGVTLAVCRMIRYCYSFLLGFKCMFQLNSSGFSILWYGYKYHATLSNGPLHPITFFYRTRFLVCVALVLRVIMCSFY